MGRKSFRLVSNGRAKEANLNDQTNPQQGHLPIMLRYASDCRKKSETGLEAARDL